MRCFDCKHFVHRYEGEKGGIHGMCEISNSDRYWWNLNKQTRFGCTPACKKFEKAEK